MSNFGFIMTTDEVLKFCRQSSQTFCIVRAKVSIVKYTINKKLMKNKSKETFFTRSKSYNYYLTPRSRVLPKKLTGFQLIKKFPAFYETRYLITAFTRAYHLSLFWAQISNVEDHPFSAVRDCLFNIFAATLPYWRWSEINTWQLHRQQSSNFCITVLFILHFYLQRLGKIWTKLCTVKSRYCGPIWMRILCSVFFLYFSCALNSAHSEPFS